MILLSLFALYLPHNTKAQEPFLSRPTYMELTQIRGLMDEGEHEKALARLRALARLNVDRPYDLAIVQQHLGYTLIALNQFSQASRAFQQAIDLEILPAKLQQPLFYLLAQLYIHESDYHQGLKTLEQWFANESQPKPQAHVLAAHGYYSIERYTEAATHLQQALAKSDKPEASWYQFLSQIYLLQKRYRALQNLLEEAIRSYPGNHAFWHMLANLHLQRGQESKALAVLMLAYRQGGLNESELRQLAQLHLHQDAPEKSARLLQLWEREGKMTNSYEQLIYQAQSWLLSREREKAIKVLQRASRLSEKGTSDLLIAKLLFDLGRWSESVDRAQKALQKGSLEDEAEARYFLAMAAFYDGQNALAVDMLEGLRDDAKLGKQAEQWLQRIRASGE